VQNAGESFSDELAVDPDGEVVEVDDPEVDCLIGNPFALAESPVIGSYY
jgi:hypothetical protein